MTDLMGFINHIFLKVLFAKHLFSASTKIDLRGKYPEIPTPEVTYNLESVNAERVAQNNKGI